MGRLQNTCSDYTTGIPLLSELYLQDWQRRSLDLRDRQRVIDILEWEPPEGVLRYWIPQINGVLSQYERSARAAGRCALGVAALLEQPFDEGELFEIGAQLGLNLPVAFLNHAKGLLKQVDEGSWVFVHPSLRLAARELARVDSRWQKMNERVCRGMELPKAYQFEKMLSYVERHIEAGFFEEAALVGLEQVQSLRFQQEYERAARLLALTQRAIQRMPLTFAVGHWLAAIVLVELELESGHFDEASRALDQASDALESSKVDSSGEMLVALLRARLCAHQGEHEAAEYYLEAGHRLLNGSLDADQLGIFLMQRG